VNVAAMPRHIRRKYLALKKRAEAAGMEFENHDPDAFRAGLPQWQGDIDHERQWLAGFGVLYPTEEAYQDAWNTIAGNFKRRKWKPVGFLDRIEAHPDDGRAVRVLRVFAA
jgi:hypothetical protein